MCGAMERGDEVLELPRVRMVVMQEVALRKAGHDVDLVYRKVARAQLAHRGVQVVEIIFHSSTIRSVRTEHQSLLFLSLAPT